MIAKTGLNAGLIALAALLIAATAYGMDALWRYEHGLVVRIALAQAVVYAAAAWIVTRGAFESSANQTRALVAILAVAAIMRMMLAVSPVVSTDIFRYIWDGRVQADGINPYVHIPAAEALAHLRDPLIHPHINRADYAPTIYPPMAQIVFFLATRIGETLTVMKLTMVGFEALAVYAIVRLLDAKGLPRSRVLLYAWHPLPLWEFAGSGHVDAIAIGFLMLAFLATQTRSPALAGMALAAGALSKYFPVVVGPAIWRGWSWRLPVAFVATAAILYVPYLSAGSKIFGFLGGYVAEEGLSNGSGFYIWSLLRNVFSFPDAAYVAYLPIAALILAAFALTFLFRPLEPGADLKAGMILAITFTVLTSPHHAWYFAWLIPFLCFYPSTSLIYLTGAAPWLLVIGWPPNVEAATLHLYGPFAVLLLIEAAIRLIQRTRKGDAPWKRSA